VRRGARSVPAARIGNDHRAAAATASFSRFHVAAGGSSLRFRALPTPAAPVAASDSNNPLANLMSEIVAEVETDVPPAGVSGTSGLALGSAPVSYADEELEVFSEDGTRAGGPAAVPQAPASGLHMAVDNASAKATAEGLPLAPTPPAVAPAADPHVAELPPTVAELPPTVAGREGTDGAQADEAAAAAAFGLTSAEATELGDAAAPAADAAAASMPAEGDFGIAYRRVAVPGQSAAAGEGQAGYKLPQQQGFQGEAQLVAAAQQNAQLQQWIGHSMATAAGHGDGGAATGVQVATGGPGAADGVAVGADGGAVDDEFSYDVDGPSASQSASGAPGGCSAGEAAPAAPAVDVEATLARLRAVEAARRTAATNSANADAAAPAGGAQQPPAAASASHGGALQGTGSSGASATGALAGGVSALAAVRAQLQSAADAEERDRVKELEQRVMAASEVVGSGASSAAPAPAAAGGAAAGLSGSGAAASATGKGKHLAALAEDNENEDEEDEDDEDEGNAVAAVGSSAVRGEAPAPAGSASAPAVEAASAATADGFPASALSAAAPVPVTLATPPTPPATSGAAAAAAAAAATPAGALATNPLMARRQPATADGTAATPGGVLPPLLPGAGARAAAGAADASEGTPLTAAIGVAESPMPAAGGGAGAGVGLTAPSAAALGAVRLVDYPALASHLLTPRRFFGRLPKVQASAKDPTAGCLGALFAQPLLPVLHPERAAVFALALTPYDPEDDVHYRAFPALYEGLTGTPFGRSGGNASWTDIGFQREADFSSDLRGAGMLGPLQSLWLLHHYPGFARKLQAAAASPRHSFPLMIQSISLTAKAMQALRWGKLNKLCNRERQSVPVSVTFMVSDVDAAPSQRPGPVFTVFNQFYGALMLTFYTLWMERGATMGQIGTLVNEVVERCYRDPAGSVSRFLEGVGGVKGHEHYDGDVGAAGFDLEAGAGRRAAGSAGSAGAGASGAAAAPASSTKGKEAAPLKLSSPLFDGPAAGKAVGVAASGSVGGRANRYAT